MSNLIDEKGNEIGHPEQFDMSIYEEKIKAIRERTLEEENAELKEQCSILADCNTCYSICKNENIEMKKQLTKAIELLNYVLLMAKVERLKGRYETVDEIEKFLKDIEP